MNLKRIKRSPLRALFWTSFICLTCLCACSEEDRAIFRAPKQQKKKGADGIPEVSTGEAGALRSKYQGALKEIGELRAEFRKAKARIETLDKDARTQIAILKQQTQGRMPDLARTEQQLTASSKAHIAHLARLDDAAAQLESRAQGCVDKLQAGDPHVFTGCNKSVAGMAKQLEGIINSMKDSQAKAEASYGSTKQRLIALSRNIEQRRW